MTNTMKFRNLGDFSAQLKTLNAGRSFSTFRTSRAFFLLFAWKSFQCCRRVVESGAFSRMSFWNHWRLTRWLKFSSPHLNYESINSLSTVFDVLSIASNLYSFWTSLRSAYSFTSCPIIPVEKPCTTYSSAPSGDNLPSTRYYIEKNKIL